MILTSVRITNYKQYGGSQEIEIPAAGTVGVIGTNGVGKTTMFEAIEWALYSPSSIRAADVRPRTWRGNTEVVVTLLDPATGNHYIVERELGKGAAKARVYRRDTSGAEEKIVDGAAQVTHYVTTRIIGLEHSAFVATFFTRQKELGFFNGSPTARRREVGKLLGLETIRSAQERIAEQRKVAQADARSYLSLSEEQGKDRDFCAEIAAAESQISEASKELVTLQTAMSAAKSNVAASQTRLSAVEALRDQDGVLGQQLLQKQREHDLARQQLSTADQELEHLSTLETERTSHESLASDVPELEDRERVFGEERRAAMRKRELEQQLANLQQREQDVRSAIALAIQQSPAPDGNAAWVVQDIDGAVQWAHSINLRDIESHAAATSRAVDSNKTLTAERKRLESYLARVADLTQQRCDALADGDPALRGTEIDSTVRELQASSAAAESTLQRTRKDLQQSERILANLEHQHEGETCPTCQRPFTAADTEHVKAVFQKDIAGYRKSIEQIQVLVADNLKQVNALNQERASLNERIKKLSDITASLEAGNVYISDQRQKVQAAEEQLANDLSAIGSAQIPDVAQKERAQHTLAAWRKVVDAASHIQRAQQTLNQVESERSPAQQELSTLATAVYDEIVHKDLVGQLEKARQAAALVQRITKELAKRETVEQARTTAAQIVGGTQLQIQTLSMQRTQLQFNAGDLQTAQAARTAALDQERLATEHLNQQQHRIRDAEHARNRVKEDQDRLIALATTAEARRKEADDLDQMYREFSEFERYAAAWYAPRLSEITSDLVAQVTDGKYDRVEFDSNFSIQIFDGDDEKFPYETFSGGERDAFALCARIALSRVIGGASATPPGFLVLDEVFGSLDLERRQRLLEMLGSITDVNDQFQQIFIISHVDDIRTSPILDEIWLVRETAAGISEIETVGVGTDIGEI